MTGAVLDSAVVSFLMGGVRWVSAPGGRPLISLTIRSETAVAGVLGVTVRALSLSLDRLKKAGIVVTWPWGQGCPGLSTDMLRELGNPKG